MKFNGHSAPMFCMYTCDLYWFLFHSPVLNICIIYRFLPRFYVASSQINLSTLNIIVITIYAYMLWVSWKGMKTRGCNLLNNVIITRKTIAKFPTLEKTHRSKGLCRIISIVIFDIKWIRYNFIIDRKDKTRFDNLDKYFIVLNRIFNLVSLAIMKLNEDSAKNVESILELKKKILTM